MGWASSLVRHHDHSVRRSLGDFVPRLRKAPDGLAPPPVLFPCHPQAAFVARSVRSGFSPHQSRPWCASKAEQQDGVAKAWTGFPLHQSRAWCTSKAEQQECLAKEENENSQEDEITSTENASSSFLYIEDSSLMMEGAEHDKASLAKLVVFWIFAAVVFGVGLGIKDGLEKASEFFAGYILEKSLSVDNLFVFVLIFKYFKVPLPYQSRVLSYGIAGAVVFRAIMILLGTATLQRFEAVNLLLAAILIYSSFKLFFAEEEETDLSDNFIVKTCQKFIPIASYYDGDKFLTIQDGVQKATPLLLTLAVVELSDVAFAYCSFFSTKFPATFIAKDASRFGNCLRSLYVLISESVGDLEYLQPAIGIVLGFIGSKMILDFFGYHVSTEVSLAIVAITIGAGILASLVKKKPDD